MTIRNDQYLHGTSAGAGAVAGAAGAAHPSNAVQVGGTDGTNLRAFKTEPDGTQHVKAAALEAILGEVVASPTANTVLARLKTLADTLGTEATLALIKTALDTLNAKDFATAAKQDAAKAVLDTIAAKDFATQTTLAAVLAQLDAASSTRASEATLADVKAAVEALAALIENGALKTALQGRIEPSVTSLLTSTPLGASATYTQSPHIDAQEYVFPNGSKGALAVSGLATSNVQGTLWLEVSNDGVNWYRAASAAVNSTGVARLRRTNLLTRYFRFKFVNSSAAQTSFALYQTIWQASDGQGNEHGEGGDRFTRQGTLAAGVTETVADIYAPAEIQDLTFATSSTAVRLRVYVYKDDGSVVPMSIGLGPDGVGLATELNPGLFDSRLLGPFEPTPQHNPGSGRYSVRLRHPITTAKGFRVQVVNTDGSNSHNAGVYVLCRLL